MEESGSDYLGCQVSKLVSRCCFSSSVNSKFINDIRECGKCRVVCSAGTSASLNHPTGAILSGSMETEYLV